MSKFKVGDKVRVLPSTQELDNSHLGVGKEFTVAELSGNCETVMLAGSSWWSHEDRFELVEEVKHAPLIDGPGLYRTRDGQHVKIVGLRSEAELEIYPGHVWKDNGDDVYLPSGMWSPNGKAESPFDIVEKISGVLEPMPEGPRAYEQPPANPEALLRQFASGATRNLDNNKIDYEGFLSPSVIEAFGKYMHSHRLQKDGTMRDSANWQAGIPLDVYMKSGWRHFFDWWKLHRGLEAASPEDGHQIDKVEALCALMFNVQGYLHELLKEQSNES